VASQTASGSGGEQQESGGGEGASDGVDGGSGNGGGSPGDALTAFAQAAVKWTAAPAPNPNVSTAFSLGWHVGQALTWARNDGAPPADMHDLGLEPDGRWKVLVEQIKAAHTQLAKDVPADGAPPPENSLPADPPRRGNEAEGAGARGGPRRGRPAHEAGVRLVHDPRRRGRREGPAPP
jgi:hypothetical protein